MATFEVSWHTDDTIGTTGYKVWYRVTGTSIWTTYMTSGTSTSIGGLTNNFIYDTQIQNLNNHDNPLSLIMQAIGITNPNPIISPTNSSIAYSFFNLSYFMTSYTIAVALAATPGTIIQSQEQSATSTVSGIFTGLTNSTNYIVSITPIASQFSATFTYPVITLVSATCAAPTNVYAQMTSGSSVFNLYWISPAIPPSSGYVIGYRPKGTPSYTVLLTSGSLTSGNTYQITEPTPACYEGYVESSCGGESFSQKVPFGVNAYEHLILSVTVSDNIATAMVSSIYSNPYITLVNITINYTVLGVPNSISGSGTYPAEVTSFVVINPTVAPETVITSYTINSISPIFDNGGNLQQFDNISTPQYFQFITSGGTWNGNPARLPSFTLDEFQVTETDISGNVLAGILNLSWIYDQTFGNGISPYNTVTLQMIDPANSSVMGSTTTATGTLGTNTMSIVITKQITAILDSNLFNLTTVWSNGSTLESISFYLPLFTP